MEIVYQKVNDRYQQSNLADVGNTLTNLVGNKWTFSWYHMVAFSAWLLCWIQKDDLDQKRISVTMLRVVSFPFIFLQLADF